ncbi:hypothetical protein E3J74_00695, partial [Candidatus Bathyarchaeota archaeon]
MERKKLLAIVISLSVILSIPLVLSSGLVDISPFSFTEESNGPTPSVFTVPTKNITDYEDPDHNVTIGSTVTFHINISDVTDLYTWHIKMSWNKDVLNGSQIVYGDFLAGTTSPNGTSADIASITGIFNDDGYGWVAESVLGEYPGVNDNGTLLEIEFLIVGYGYTDINVSLTGDLPTELLDSVGNNMTFTTAAGYFSNTMFGDITGPEDPPASGEYPPDGVVDGWDMTRLSKAYGSSPGSSNWDIVCDITGPEDPPASGEYPPDG